MRKIIMTAGALVLALGVSLPSQAAVAVAIAPPGSGVNPIPYATPVVVSPAGTEVTFINADPVATHNVVSRAAKGNGQPLFTSGPLAPAGAYAVAGTAALAAGDYEFFCTAHAWMTGTLTVV
ncbi:MAG: plastocyanin/azurin family copper-binding protein [Acidimicrobiia bacterium]|nr:plastocyanin/azurin family copper-binding protein [Acidimicrobiia bacterium]